MIKVIESEKKNYIGMFQEYTHSIPAIYSSLEGQYEGELYVDSIENCGYAILVTPFEYCYVAGNMKIEGIRDELDNLLFHSIINERKEKEIIVFSPKNNWYPVLEDVFDRHYGLQDVRKVYHLNKHRFYAYRKDCARKIDQIKKGKGEIAIQVAYEKEFGSHREYPICRIYNKGQCIGFCSAATIGREQGEIDIHIDERYRNHGYGTIAAMMLIEEVLKKGIEPCWCTWSYHTQSQAIAKRIGFVEKEDVPAFIWTQEACGSLI